MAQSVKPRLLLLLHCYHNRAGVEEHLRTLAGALQDSYRLAIAFPEQGQLCLMRPGERLLAFPGENLNILAPYRAPRLEASLNRIIELTDPDLIHLVHFVNWHLGLFQQLKASGRPLVMSFHDYYAATPYYTMQGESDPARTISPEYARSVFGRDVSQYLAQRREVISAGLAQAQALVVPSPYLAGVLQQIFPFKFRVIEYGIRPFRVKPAPKAWPELRFGYFGSLLPQKGWQPLLEAFRLIEPGHPDVQLHFYGGSAETPSPQVHFHGVFNQPDLPEILSQVNVGIIPSVFAETYSLVLSELWMAGLPAAVSDIGAMGERVQDLVNGRKFAPGDPARIAEVLEWFITCDDWKRWTPPPVRLAGEMAEEYDSLYQRLLAG